MFYVVLHFLKMILQAHKLSRLDNDRAEDFVLASCGTDISVIGSYPMLKKLLKYLSSERTVQRSCERNYQI